MRVSTAASAGICLPRVGRNLLLILYCGALTTVLLCFDELPLRFEVGGGGGGGFIKATRIYL